MYIGGALPRRGKGACRILDQKLDGPPSRPAATRRPTPSASTEGTPRSARAEHRFCGQGLPGHPRIALVFSTIRERENQARGTPETRRRNDPTVGSAGLAVRLKGRG